MSDEVLLWLSVWSKVQLICIWCSWCHCHPVILCFIKIQNSSGFLVLTYLVVLKKRLLNTCSNKSKSNKSKLCFNHRSVSIQNNKQQLPRIWQNVPEAHSIGSMWHSLSVKIIIHCQSKHQKISLRNIQSLFAIRAEIKKTRSHPEMVGDMSRVTLNYDLSKIPFVHL